VRGQAHAESGTLIAKTLKGAAPLRVLVGRQGYAMKMHNACSIFYVPCNCTELLVPNAKANRP